MKLFTLVMLGSSAMLLVIIGCAATEKISTTDRTDARIPASNEALRFECVLAKDNTTGVSILTAAREFKDTTKSVIATIEVFKAGQLVEKSTNAMIGERMVPSLGPKGLPIWNLNASLGRSGSVSMGYDSTKSSWYLISNMMLFSTNAKGEKALCAVSDSSGMAH